ncbi:MAG: flippase [Candidatus Methanospirareceae archaeon]
MTEEIVNESLKKVAKGTTIASFGMLLYLLLEFLTRIIVARNSTQSEYGEFSIGFVLLYFFTTASCLGLTGGIPRCIAYFRGKGDDNKVREVIFSAIQLSSIASISGFVLFFILSDHLSSLFHLQNPVVLKIFSLALPFSVAIEILASIFLGFDRVEEKVYFRDILLNVLKVVFVAIAILLSPSFSHIIISYVLATITAALAFMGYATKKMQIGVKSNITKDLFFFSLPLLVTYTLTLTILQIDTLLLGYFKTADIVGLYNAAHPLSQLITIFLVSLVFIYIPIASQLFSKNLVAEMKRSYAIITKWVFSATFPLFLALFLFPDTFLRFFFGSPYTNASLALRILAIGMLIHVFLGPNAATLIVIGKTKLNMVDDLIGAIANVTLNILLIPPFGINGAAIACTISLAVINILKSTQIFLTYDIHPFTKNYIKPIIASTALIPMLIKSIFSTPFLFLLSFLLAYSGCFLLTRSFDKEDAMILEEIGKILGGDISHIKRIIRKFM